MSHPEYTTRMVKMNQTQQLWLSKSTVDLSSPKYVQTVHWHDFFELELVITGQAIHILNGTPYPIQAGSLYLLTPADLHTLIPDPSCDDPRITVLNIGFSNTIVSETSFVEVQTLPPPLTAEAQGENLIDFMNMAHRLLDEKQAKGPHSDDILRHTFLTFIFKFLRLYHLQHSHTEGESPSTMTDRELTYIRNAIAYIRYNFRDPTISITKIAAAVCLSPNYFGTIFKKHMKENCLSYIKKMRLNFATVLLQNSQLTVAEISEKCGYANAPYFISDFRATYGMPPKKHRDTKDGKKD